MKKIILPVILLASLSLNAQTLLKDIRNGFDGSNPTLKQSLVINDYTYFLADEGDNLNVLYKTDGTEVNTQRVAGGSANGNIYFSNIMGEINGEILLIGLENYSEYKLYKTNTTTNNLTFIKDFDLSNLTSIDIYVVLGKMNNEIYFFAGDGNTGFELWKTNGTSAGTNLVKDINPGSGNSAVFVTGYGILNNEMFFCASTDSEGAELWKSNGTESGTVLVKDIEPNNSFGAGYGSNPTLFCTYNSKVYFSAYESTHGRELWVTDGTSAGTQMIKDLAPGDGYPEELIVYDNRLFFTANTPTGFGALYASDGTSAGTQVFYQTDISGSSDISELTLHNGFLFFSGYENNTGNELWRSNGQPAGTVRVVDIADGVTSSNPSELVSLNGSLYFFAADINGAYQLYKTNGSQSDTWRMSSFSFSDNGIDIFESIAKAGDCVMYNADQGTTGNEPYVSCASGGIEVGIEESFSASIHIYPNPVSHQMYIQSDLTGNTQLEWINMAGSTLFMQQINMAAPNTAVAIPGNLPAGIYLLKITNGESVYNHKLIIAPEH